MVRPYYERRILAGMMFVTLHGAGSATAFLLLHPGPRHRGAPAGLRRHRAASSCIQAFGLRAEPSSSSASAPSSSSSSTSSPHPPDEAPEPDLFEYFDPLLSPHAYPNGIVPPSSSKGRAPLEEYEEAATAATAKKASSIPAAAAGSASRALASDSSSSSSSSSSSDESGLKDPLRMDRLDVLGVSHPDPKRYRKEDYDSVKLDNLNFLGVGTGQSSWPRDQLGLPVVGTYEAVFDPTVSPHKYPHGTPSEVLATRREEEEEGEAYQPTEDALPPPSPSPIVGILLIDHGSKRESSNQRLHDMASWYQECVPSVAVEAAHMEIASPSIKEGMAKLLERGAEEIVCHPFFLGTGRHVNEDIPRLIEQAMDELDVEVPVRTTAHVGSDMSMMLEAVHALVKQSSTLLAQSRTGRP